MTDVFPMSPLDALYLVGIVVVLAFMAITVLAFIFQSLPSRPRMWLKDKMPWLHPKVQECKQTDGKGRQCILNSRHKSAHDFWRLR